MIRNGDMIRDRIILLGSVLLGHDWRWKTLPWISTLGDIIGEKILSVVLEIRDGTRLEVGGRNISLKSVMGP